MPGSSLRKCASFFSSATYIRRTRAPAKWFASPAPASHPSDFSQRKRTNTAFSSTSIFRVPTAYLRPLRQELKTKCSASLAQEHPVASRHGRHHSGLRCPRRPSDSRSNRHSPFRHGLIAITTRAAPSSSRRKPSAISASTEAQSRPRTRRRNGVVSSSDSIVSGTHAPDRPIEARSRRQRSPHAHRLPSTISPAITRGKAHKEELIASSNTPSNLQISRRRFPWLSISRPSTSRERINEANSVKLVYRQLSEDLVQTRSS